MGKPTASADELSATPKPSTLKPDYHWAYSLPESIADQYHWKGTDADLHYGLAEPTPAQIAEIGRDPNRQVKDIAVGFVRALGQLGPDGKVERDETGLPVLRPAGYLEIGAWYDRIGSRGVQLVVGEFQSLFMPSKIEGEALRASRRRR